MDKMEIPKVTNVPFPFFFDFLNLVVDVKDGEDGGMSQWVTEDIFTAGGVTAFTARTIRFCVDLWRRRVSRTVWEIRSCLRGSHPGFRGILPPPHLSQVCFCTLSLHRRDGLNSKGPQFFIFPKTRFISAKAASPSSPRLRVQKQEKKKSLIEVLDHGPSRGNSLLQRFWWGFWVKVPGHEHGGHLYRQ